MNSFVVVVYLYRPIKPSSCMKAYYYQKCVGICNRGKICGRLFFIPQRPEAFPFRRRAFVCAKPWSCGLALIISFYCMDHHKKGLLPCRITKLGRAWKPCCHATKFHDDDNGLRSFACMFVQQCHVRQDKKVWYFSDSLIIFSPFVSKS